MAGRLAPPRITELAASVGLDQACKSAQWSRDGTCILTNSGHERGQLDTFVVPHDLLTDRRAHVLQPYASLKLAEPAYASVAYPFFDLSSPATTLVLSSSKDHPVQLHNALAYTLGPVATYPLVSEKEDCITPSSLVFSTDASHFIAGSDRYLSVFDVSRSGEPAVEMHRTIPSRKAMKRVGGVGINGVISTLDISPEGLLAAGTFARAVGLYSSEGRGECVSLFKLDERHAPGGQRMHGTGVTKLSWSPCGRYLYVSERRADLVLVYDIRVTGTLLATLVGRAGDTNQRLDFDLVPTSGGQGHEIWSGGTDGFVRVWRDPQHHTGDVAHDWQYAAHTDPVVSSIVHPSGTLLATCGAANRAVPTAREPHHVPEASPETSRGTDTNDHDHDRASTRDVSQAFLKLWSIS